LFGQMFQPIGHWTAWRSFLAAVYGLSMEADGLATFQRQHGSSQPADGPRPRAGMIERMRLQ